MHYHRIRLSPSLQALLGTMPDRCVAAHLGVSVTRVFRGRTALGSPAYRTHAASQRSLDVLDAHPEGLDSRNMPIL